MTGRDKLLADAAAAGYRVNRLADGTVTVLKGVRPPSGLIIYPNGTAFLADVQLDVAKGIRSFAVMRQLLDLPRSDDKDDKGFGGLHLKRKAPGTQLQREIAETLGVFYLTDTKEQPLGPEFSSRNAAKRAAMKLVREGSHARVEVWHRWRGDRYMQGLASKEGWSDV